MKIVLLTVLKWLLAAALLLVAAVVAFVYLHPTFGGKPDAASMAKIQASPQFDGEKFNNAEPTGIDTSAGGSPSLLDWLSSVLNPPEGKQPGEPLPSVKLDAAQLQNGDFVWLGHSTVLLKTDNQTLITDPVFYRASPIALAGSPFAVTHTPITADLPPLDAVLISHDHYDHLDYRAIKEIAPKTKRFYVPLGVKAHLQRWGIADNKIIELDWHESAKLGNIDLTLAPARHFSGRNFNNRFSTLWGSWVVKSPDLSLYFNGDSGYGRHFADIGAQYGPFDFAMIENGAYNENWANIHMTPEQSVQAAQDVRAAAVMPVHWAKFDLAYHTWREPIERFMAAAEDTPLQTATPQIGQVFNIRQLPQVHWWEGVK
ncbi:MBL fold metallo-hydrolase [Uruburuella testudinis]|uniref:MBL fold metallo-hydrolase n=1 Tax=Uruburuella testudinis TaxID=1282863 RepID=A0ABY4DQN3_9NEIS|nr:MBL fold metallo-hydrolase [Uruburuella testudinis]UOO80932.1 MBL fold metallo-hydrolase [Uruburuella testudinis]